MTVYHPAAEWNFHALHGHLKAYVETGLVSCNVDAAEGLELYCYTKQCVFERKWDDITSMARGLILDTVNQKVIAFSFSKFFNIGEAQTTIPDLPFETFEKVDGSLIIAFYHNGRWRTATKGSLNSDQAKWAQEQIKPFSDKMLHGYTYLFEGIYPENRIVVKYDFEGLVLLSAYDHTGKEQSYQALQAEAWNLKVRIAKRYAYASIADLLIAAETLPPDEEGWVLRFNDGTRLKIKGAEYRRIHALVSRLTPLGVWEALREGQDMDALKREIPEEFWEDFDSMLYILHERFYKLIERVHSIAVATRDLTDKELGLILNTLPPPEARFIFPYRKASTFTELTKGPARHRLFEEIRPKGNRLEGYRPSYAVTRVHEELAS